jgi:hypothetical protein
MERDDDKALGNGVFYEIVEPEITQKAPPNDTSSPSISNP